MVIVTILSHLIEWALFILFVLWIAPYIAQIQPSFPQTIVAVCTGMAGIAILDWIREVFLAAVDS